MRKERVEWWFLRLVGPLIESPPKIFRRTFLRGIFRIRDKEDRDRKVVYLTFDDGPIPECTPWLLDELDRLGVKATFFMVGDNVRKYSELYAECVRRGHKVGNHTMHHLNGVWCSFKKYLNDVSEAATYIDSTLFRPPHGWMRVDERELLNRHFDIIMYDLVTRDYSRYITAGRVVENVKRLARPGSIIVFHDSLKSVHKLRTALAESVEWLREQGYEFELIPNTKKKLTK